MLTNFSDRKLRHQIINLLLPYKDYNHTIKTDNGAEFADEPTVLYSDNV
jgi:hypothetical protein